MALSQSLFLSRWSRQTLQSSRTMLGQNKRWKSHRQQFFSTTTKTKSKSKSTSKSTSSSDTTVQTSNLSRKFWNNEFTLLNERYSAIGGMNVSEICGNVASILTLAAYTMTDILALRLTAIVATILSLTFQYYRTVPLWIPIRWNMVLLMLNTTMVTSLYLERQRAEQMSPELEKLYQNGDFGSRGFSRVEFLRLVDRASTITLNPHTVLVKQGEAKESLCFLVEGSVCVQKKGKTIAHLDPYHFIGEISLLSRMSSKDQWDSAATADVVVSGKKSATLLEWKFDELIPYLREDREVRNALSAYINYDLTSKLLRDGQLLKLQRHSSISAETLPPPSTGNRSRSDPPQASTIHKTSVVTSSRPDVGQKKREQ